MNVKPRSYQKICLENLAQARSGGKDRALVVMASGLGKTLTCAFDIQEFLKTHPNGRVLVLCHTEPILSQIKAVFRDFFGDEYSYGMYNGEEKAAHRTDFLFANLQSVYLHMDKFDSDEFNYVAVDEAHHSAAVTFRTAIEFFHPEFLLGLTATPERMDNADITDIFGEMVFEYRLTEAVQDGWLSGVDYRIKTDEIKNLEAVLDSGKRFSLSQLNREVFVPKRDEEIVRIIRKDIADKDDPTMVIFCQSIQHADRFAELMGDAVVIHSDMSPDEKKERLKGFYTGEIKTVCAVNMLNEGIDVPRTDVVVFLRVTQSKIVFTQQLGRGLRLAEGKGDVLVLDFVSTAERLEMLFQIEREFKESKGRYPRTKSKKELKHFMLNIDNPNFQERKVDIIALIERAKRVFCSNEELLAMLREKAKGIGRTPYQREIDDDISMPSASVYKSRFGSYHKALEAAELVHRPSSYSDEDLLDALRKKAKELGRAPVKRELEKDSSMPSRSTYSLRFGSYHKALEAADLVPNSRILYSDEELLDMLKKKAEELGRVPFTTEVDADPSMPSSATYYSRFDDYDDAVKKAGLIPIQYSPRHYSDKRLINMLKKKAEELGRTPTVSEIYNDPNMPAPATFASRFGSHKKAMLAAGLKPNLSGKHIKRS